MISKIDWLSFTFELEGEGNIRVDQLWSMVHIVMMAKAPVCWQVLVEGRQFHPCRTRAPYASAMQREDGAVMIFASPNRNEVLVEVGGKGCAYVAGAGMMSQLLREEQLRSTRIDIATDILTDIEPEMFASDRKVLRTKSHSEFTSSSGSTCYVGSRKSDRYARIYRYFPPHPRSHLLRVEHVIKAEQSRETIVQILGTNVEEVVAKLGNTMGWQHPVWQPDVVTDEKMAAWRPERRNASTVAWIYNQCLPAIARLIKDGTLETADIKAALAELGVDFSC